MNNMASKVKSHDALSIKLHNCQIRCSTLGTLGWIQHFQKHRTQQVHQFIIDYYILGSPRYRAGPLLFLCYIRR